MKLVSENQFSGKTYFYTIAPAFLEELNSCASDFKAYMANLAQSIRLAATEIALGIVHRRAEAMSHQGRYSVMS